MLVSKWGLIRREAKLRKYGIFTLLFNFRGLLKFPKISKMDQTLHMKSNSTSDRLKSKIFS